MGDRIIRFGKGFSTDDGWHPSYGSLHFWHEDVAHLLPGDRVVIEAEVARQGLIGCVTQDGDGLYRQEPTRVVELKSGFSIRKAGPQP